MRPAAQSNSSRRSQAGYNLVILVMAITVLNIMVAVALPVWSHAIKREKEEELIFRGLQYAEAIRVFQKRHGRYPSQLDELIKLRPRCIRQLWTDPMSEDGQWGLLVAGPQPQAGGRRGRGSRRGQQELPPLRPGEFDVTGRRQPAPPRGRQQQRPATLVPIAPGGKQGRLVGGQIQGVFSASQEQSIKSFLDRNQYSQWHFTVALIRMPAVVGGDLPVPRASSDWIGRPFRGNIKPPGAVPPRPAGSGKER